MTKMILAMSTLVATGCLARTGFGIATETRATAQIPLPAPAVAQVELAPSGGGEAAPAAYGTGKHSDANAAGGGAYAPGEDAHWLRGDDYLISDDPYAGKKLELHVAKVIQAPSGNTKGEAQFLRANGESGWTATYYRTRIAQRTDLRVGALAFCSGGWWDKTPEPPKSKHDARQRKWILAAITDTADLYKGRVTVGNASCALGAVRVPVRGD